MSRFHSHGTSDTRQAYFQQSEPAQPTTVPRILYTLTVTLVLGLGTGIVAGIIVFDVWGIERADTVAGALDVQPVFQAIRIGTWSLGVLVVLAASVRAFHRRSFATVLAGHGGVRWRRLLRWGGGAGAVVAGLAGLASVAGAIDLGGTGWAWTVGIAGMVATALAHEALRAYLLQSVAARFGGGEGGTGVATGVVVAGFPALVFALLAANDLASVFGVGKMIVYAGAYVAVFGWGLGALVLVDGGIERSMGVGAALWLGVLVAASGGIGAPVLAAGLGTAAVAGGLGVLAWRERWTWIRIRQPFTQPTPDSGATTPDERTDADDACPNCGAPRTGRYCVECGQKRRENALSVSALFARIAGEIFEIDSRLLRTARYLFFRPGALTQQYVAGRRRSFLRPLRLYLFASFLFFILFSLIVPSNPVLPGPDEAAATDTIEVSASRFQTPPDTLASTGGARAQSPAADSARTESTVAVVPARDQGGVEQAVQIFLQNAAQATLLLVPIFALLLQVVFLSRPYGHHFIFSLHVHAFAFLFLCSGFLMHAFSLGEATLAAGWFVLVVAVFGYVLTALRRVYEIGWVRTLVVGVVVLNLYFVAATFVFGAAVGILEGIVLK